MNERIKELRRQAIDHCLDKGSQGNLSEEVAEKFAELIVRECVAMADDFECDVNQSGLVDRMKQHFGVK